MQKELDWYNLLGKSLEFKELANLINIDNKEYEMKEFKVENNVFKYYNFYQDGITLEYKDNVFTTAYLYGKHDKKFKNYTGILPYYLNFDLDNSQIVGFFGEPNKKNGGHTVPINIQYEQLGLDFTFVSPIWDLIPNYISFISLYEKNTDPNNIICNLCRKKAESCCGQCRITYYCSVNCQKNHWKVHKSYCQKYYTTKN